MQGPADPTQVAITNYHTKHFGGAIMITELRQVSASRTERKLGIEEKPGSNDGCAANEDLQGDANR